jgi:hypothetical protein
LDGSTEDLGVQSCSGSLKIPLDRSMELSRAQPSF